VHRFPRVDASGCGGQDAIVRRQQRGAQEVLKRLEGDIRTEISTLEEQASFDPASEGRFILGLTLTPRENGADTKTEP
jgi:hypothetical protein